MVLFIPLLYFDLIGEIENMGSPVSLIFNPSVIIVSLQKTLLRNQNYSLYQKSHKMFLSWHYKKSSPKN